MQTWQLSVWFGSLLVACFAAGCTWGYTFSRNKNRKASHAHRRVR